ncbi:unnamed protein product [Rotaria sp. Silwood1]|nr:unnamed protein product [Rotaria sp. Silwood1]
MPKSKQRTTAGSTNTVTEYNLEEMIEYLRQNPNAAYDVHKHLTQVTHLQHLNFNAPIDSSTPYTPKPTNATHVPGKNPVLGQLQQQPAEQQQYQLPFEQLKRAVSSNLPCFLIEFNPRTLRKNKSEIPMEFLPNKTHEVGSLLFGFEDNLTLVSFVPKKNKAVLLLSSKHHDNQVDNKTGKPIVVLNYNKTKGAVDTVDQICHKYTVKRGTKRWPLCIFYGMIDVTALNAFILWKAKNPEWNRDKRYQRRLFLEELGLSLVTPLLDFRSKTSKFLHKDIQNALAIVGHPVAKRNSQKSNEDSAQGKRKRCSMRETSKDRKTSIKCYNCSACNHRINEKLDRMNERVNQAALDIELHQETLVKQQPLLVSIVANFLWPMTDYNVAGKHLKGTRVSFGVENTVIVDVSGLSEKIRIIAIYWPACQNRVLEELEPFIIENTILTGDFNAAIKEW